MNNDMQLQQFSNISTTLLPRIPNAENRNLETKIDTKQHRFQIVQNDLEDNTLKVRMLEDHLKNVQDELGTTQDEVYRANQQFDEMKSQMKWDQQALEAWLEESAQKDEDVMALMKYTRQDEAKVKELMFKIERMTDESSKKKRAVENEIMDTTGLQVELDKTASNFRKGHEQRQQLIQNWEQIIEQMQGRDRDIDLLAAQLVKIKAEARSVEELIIEKKEFYDNEQRNNNERQLQMSIAERQAAKFRLQYDEAEKNRLLYENELSGLRRVVKRTEKDKEMAYALLGQMKKQLTEQRQQLDDLRIRKRELVDRKREILDTKYTAEEKATKMEKLFVDEQERENQLNNELKFLSERMYKITQQIFDYKTKEKNLDAEINGSIVTLNNLQSKTDKLDHDALKQQEVLYHQDFEIQSLERRINRMQGEKSTDEQAELERKINDLQIQLQQKRDDHVILTNQTKQIQEETRRLKRSIDDTSKEREKQVSKIEELDLHSNNAQREIQKLNEQKENLLVEEHLMKIEIKRFRTSLYSHSDTVMTLETRKLQLQTAIKERRSEINIHQSTLRQQLLDEQTKTSEVSGQLHDRIAKIDKLKKRYQIVNISMAPPEGAGEEESSQTYYVIKAAQEKEELQREGDELDAKIRKAEQELRALENTLRIVNTGNNITKDSFKKLTDSSDELAKLEELDEQSRHMRDKLGIKRKKLKELQDDLTRMERAINDQSNEKNNMNEIVFEKHKQYNQLQVDVNDFRDKINRTESQIGRRKKEALGTKRASDLLNDEQDIEVRLLQDYKTKISAQIEQIVSVDQDALHHYNMLKQQFELAGPTSGVGTPSSSSRTSSTRSSTSQQRSTRPAMPVREVQLDLAATRPPTNGHTKRPTSRGSSTTSSSSTSSSRRLPK
ncbi:unnamed protein product [Didymodactylos carnosus]|uniref:Coiled-coil domain-containing protein 39 n=1 Tax=Didymodactylos carnosus TaxID=1234261 RepID=A0A813TQA1_9BILA|nr:unnamed protein product [Didymodactylos carnosus]CAF0878295.1 unnamed protein product [Didymodactylos carnosus]CAF3600534.1 unnamed protein product [Didymodactylos carnosus]CAF3662359.1 unnamed protein product [Didymodactylos carnosus]